MKSKPVIFIAVLLIAAPTLSFAFGSSAPKPQQTPREEVRDIHVAQDGSPNTSSVTAGVEANSAFKGKVVRPAASPSRSTTP